MQKHNRTKEINKMGNNILFDVAFAPVRLFNIFLSLLNKTHSFISPEY